MMILIGITSCDNDDTVVESRQQSGKYKLGGGMNWTY